MTEIQNVWKEEYPVLRAIVLRYAAGALVWIINQALGALMFTEKGLPRNPASAEKGHRPWITKAQRNLAALMIRLLGLKPGIVSGKKEIAFNPQPRLREA